MKNIRLSASHAISGQDLPKWESLENREVSPEHKKTLEMPVAFSYREGLVRFFFLAFSSFSAQD